jgi:hypothetical protein
VKGDSNQFTQSTRARWQYQPLLVIEIEATLDGKSFEYRVEIGFAGAARDHSVNLERLSVSGTTVFELAGGQIRFFPNDSSSIAVPLQTNRSVLHLSQLWSQTFARERRERHRLG